MLTHVTKWCLVWQTTNGVPQVINWFNGMRFTIGPQDLLFTVPQFRSTSIYGARIGRHVCTTKSMNRARLHSPSQQGLQQGIQGEESKRTKGSAVITVVAWGKAEGTSREYQGQGISLSTRDGDTAPECLKSKPTMDLEGFINHSTLVEVEVHLHIECLSSDLISLIFLVKVFY